MTREGLKTAVVGAGYVGIARLLSLGYVVERIGDGVLSGPVMSRNGHRAVSRRGVPASEPQVTS
jgi:hypothetical protein